MKEDLTKFQVNEVVLNDNDEIVSVQVYDCDDDRTATDKFNELTDKGHYNMFARRNTISYIENISSYINDKTVRACPAFGHVTRCNIHMSNVHRLLVYVEINH